MSDENDTNSTSRPYPFDYDALDKGTDIAPESCERVIGKFRGHPTYQRDLNALAQRVEKDMRVRHKMVVVCCRKDGLRIMTDAEAAVYTQRAFDLHIRGAIRENRDQIQAIDPGNLSDEQKRVHQRNQQVNSMGLTGFRTAKRQAIKLLTHQRRSPGLPGNDPKKN